MNTDALLTKRGFRVSRVTTLSNGALHWNARHPQKRRQISFYCEKKNSPLSISVFDKRDGFTYIAPTLKAAIACVENEDKPAFRRTKGSDLTADERQAIDDRLAAQWKPQMERLAEKLEEKAKRNDEIRAQMEKFRHGKKFVNDPIARLAFHYVTSRRRRGKFLKGDPTLRAILSKAVWKKARRYLNQRSRVLWYDTLPEEHQRCVAEYNDAVAKKKSTRVIAAIQKRASGIVTLQNAVRWLDMEESTRINDEQDTRSLQEAKQKKGTRFFHKLNKALDFYKNQMQKQEAADLLRYALATAKRDIGDRVIAPRVLMEWLRRWWGLCLNRKLLPKVSPPIHRCYLSGCPPGRCLWVEQRKVGGEGDLWRFPSPLSNDRHVRRLCKEIGLRIGGKAGAPRGSKHSRKTPRYL